MGAMQRSPSKPRRKRIERIELDHLDVARSHPLEEAAVRQHTAPAVVDYIDLHALLLFRDQRIGELVPNPVAVEGIGFEIDVVRRTLDRAEHRAIRRSTVLENRHIVSQDQRTSADCLLESKVAL